MLASSRADLSESKVHGAPGSPSRLQPAGIQLSVMLTPLAKCGCSPPLLGLYLSFATTVAPGNQLAQHRHCQFPAG